MSADLPEAEVPQPEDASDGDTTIWGFTTPDYLGLQTRSGGMVQTECGYCGATINRPEHRVENTTNLFCNYDCRGAFQSLQQEGEANPSWKGGKMTVLCEWCGDDITGYPSVLKQSERNFCNHDCQGEWLSEYRSGKNSPSWEGGHEWRYYGPSWRSQRRKALERDGHECVECGLSEEDHREEHGQGLDVHHLISFREYGLKHHEEANRLDNLVSVCRPCHAEVEK